MKKNIIISVLVFLLIISLFGCDVFDESDEEYQLSGRIINEFDEPLPEASLSFSDSFGTAETDDNGYWSKSGLEGEVVVTPLDDYWEFEPSSRTVSGEDSNVNFTAIIPDEDDDLNDDFAGGSGTVADPFLIETAEQLDNVRNYVDSHFLQIADIDLANYNLGEDWEPIGGSREEDYFNGNYDGGNYTIYNFSNSDRSGRYGLFLYVGENGQISNLNLEDFDLEVAHTSGALVSTNYGQLKDIYFSGSLNVSTVGDLITGGLVGRNYEEGIISDVIGNVEVIGESTGQRLGGLVGHNLGKITSSSIEGTVTSISGHIGGLVGRNEGEIKFSDSYVEVTSEGSDIGGLVGISQGENAYIYESYAGGEVNGQFRVGGLVGSNSDTSQILSCEATGNANGETRVGGLIGNNVHTNVERQEVRASNASGNVTASWDAANSSNYAGGLIGNNNNSDVINSYASGRVEVLRRSAGGLIGSNRDGLIKDSYAVGDVIATGHADRIGGLIGNASNNSEIENCYATGYVEAENSDIGGLIGILYSGNSDKVERIYRSYATGDVSSSGSNVGGLVGGVSSSTSGELIGIKESYATGTVSSQDRNVGGLVGTLSGGSILKNSYATGDVEGNLGDNWSSAYAGGLVGRVSRNTEVSNCYAANKVSGIGDNISGLFGTKLSPAIVEGSYIDSTLSGHGDNEYGFLKSTAEMQQKATFENWNFEEVWNIDEGISYPYL